MKKQDAQPGTLRKLFDVKEGDDFFARYLFGLGSIRSCVYKKSEDRLLYDKSFNRCFNNLVEMKFVIEKATGLLSQHVEDIKQGVDGKYHGNQIDVTNPIDNDLNIFFKDCFIRGTMAIDGLIKHANFMGFDISFLFSDNDKKFNKGVKSFSLDENNEKFKSLLNFIKEHKKGWYSDFKEMRRIIIHEGWTLPDIKYILDENKKVKVLFPLTLNNRTIDEILFSSWSNINYFCEEIITFLLSLKLDVGNIILLVPEEKRSEYQMVRYIVSHEAMPWARLSY